MHPDLFSLGFLDVKTYGACMALGFLEAWQVITWLCRRTGRNPEPLSNLLLLMMVVGVVGARLAYVIEHWTAEFAAAPLRVLRVDQGGLMFYGGFILAALVFVAWCRAHRERILPLTDLFAVVVPLGHAFGRIGCFFYGCCYGRLAPASACAVAFPRGSPAWHEQLREGLISSNAAHALPVLPTQLFEAAAVALLFAALCALYCRFWKRAPGLLSGAYLVGYACIRFGIEILRGDPRAAVGPFSISQTISLALFLVGATLVVRAITRRGNDS